MKTAEQIIDQYFDANARESSGNAKALISELKSEGYIVVDASVLAKNISSAMTGGGAFIE